MTDTPADTPADATTTTAEDGVLAGSAAAAIDADAVLALAGRLVRAGSGDDPDAVAVGQPASEVIADAMRSFGWTVHLAEIAPGRPNVVGIADGTAPGRTLMFAAHSGVAMVRDRTAWSFDPYAGDVVNGMLRGRGSADAAGALAAMLFAARAVQQTGFAGRIMVAAVADGGDSGHRAATLSMSDLAQAEIDGVIVGQPSSGIVCSGAPGVLRVRVEFTGEMSHSATPNAGRNPITALGPLIVGLGELEKQIQQSTPAHPELGTFTLTPTAAAAGPAEQPEVVPRTAELSLDMRTIPSTGHRALVEVFTRLARQIADDYELRSAVEVVEDRPVEEASRTAPVVAAVAVAHEQTTGATATYGVVPGSAGNTVPSSRDGAPATVIYGPGSLADAHRTDEACAVQDILTAARVYAEAADRFLGGSR